jgi:hypothetical protein
MNDSVKNNSFNKAKQMFNSFDVDNEDHSVILIMYDKSDGQVNMVTLNTSAEVAVNMLGTAMSAVMDLCNEVLDEVLDEAKVLN